MDPTAATAARPLLHEPGTPEADNIITGLVGLVLEKSKSL